MFSFKNHFYFVLIPPLIPITICFILGILAYYVSSKIVITFGLFFSFLFYLFNYKNSFFHTLSKYFLCFLIFLTGAYLHYKKLDNYHHFYTILENKPLSITGTITDKSNHHNNYTETVIISLSTSSIIHPMGIIYSPKNIQIHCSPNDNLQIGAEVTFFNVQCKKPDTESFCHYQIKEHIAATIFAIGKKYHINHKPYHSVRGWIFNQKMRILKNLEKKMSSSCFLFFSSLFLGNRAYVKNIMQSMDEQFKQWGIYHLLARSGMHLALFIFTWQMILRFIPLPFLIKQCLMLLLCFLYDIFSWSSAPFLRSLVLFTFNKICFFAKTPYHLLHYLTLTSVCFLLYCPLFLFFLDFQLSFGLTFALAWLNQLYGQHFYAQERTIESNY